MKTTRLHVSTATIDRDEAVTHCSSHHTVNVTFQLNRLTGLIGVLLEVLCYVDRAASRYKCAIKPT
jgi:hypothetical protein